MWSSQAVLRRPCRSLLAIFTSWKAFLLTLALFSPGPGYDTSTTLAECSAHNHGPLSAILSLISTKLTRWDAIYFTESARRGYMFEQEWAFSLSFAKLIASTTNTLERIIGSEYACLENIAAIAISHVSHGISVLVLYSIARAVFPGAPGRKLAFIAACLHVCSPAGIFLSAPYGESTHALLSFTGSLLFVRSFSPLGPPTALQDATILLSGIMYGLSTIIRSNGLLNGMILLEEALRLLYAMVTAGVNFVRIRRLFAVGIAGVCTGLGFVVPQYLAYQEYCVHHVPAQNEGLRPWCHKTLPSIYSFVQDHYWNNGFLRYWTLSNVPLFALAAPMIAIMTCSALWTFSMKTSASNKTTDAAHATEASTTQMPLQTHLTGRLLRSLAAPQITLAVLTFLNHHVQVITRMSSGYPMWYMWVAFLLVEGRVDQQVESPKQYSYARMTVAYMVVYAIVQGVLFASFLPPA
ncbi:GPI mannosyltransferase 2 [Aspergillus avenaceus]|uniref:GPI mannosyltransferase 2 n=1 Tax=Aspergillus avenaceus TaxID=36643 RepID=A0A5N6TXB1_ASPAV|nr:GPI mannosyltransferase 2 [Aspergillus avenaceus]